MGNCCSRRSLSDLGGAEGIATNTNTKDDIDLARANRQSTAEVHQAIGTFPAAPDDVHTARDKADVLAPHSSKGVEISPNDRLDHALTALPTKPKQDPSSLEVEANHNALRDTKDVPARYATTAKLTSETHRAVPFHKTPLGDDDAHVLGGSTILEDHGTITTLPLAAEQDSVLPGDHEDLIGPDSSAKGQVTGNDFNLTVLPTNTEASPASPEDETDIFRLREKCPRFRILVIGKANAGKTTILQKMCNTTEAPIIQDKDGNIVDASVINPTDGRGIHDINNELTFSSDSGFVFHDSPGFEAGSIKELENVQEFIAKRAVARNLKEQLHAIWFCLPSDNARPLSDAEMAFFKHGTGRVPVIAIFTKYDGMILTEYNRLRFEEKYTKPEATKWAPIYADQLFRDSDYYLKRLQGAAHPPARYLRVQGMHLEGSSCVELSKQTIDALDNKKLQLLFVSVQQVNVELCTEYALKNYIFESESGK